VRRVLLKPITEESAGTGRPEGYARPGTWFRRMARTFPAGRPADGKRFCGRSSVGEGKQIWELESGRSDGALDPRMGNSILTISGGRQENCGSREC